MARLHSTLRFALACAVLASPSAVHAATFDVVRSGPDVVTVLDRAAVTPLGEGRMRRAWSVSVQRTLSTEGPQQPGYVRTLYDYDCVERKIRWQRFFAYSRFGDLVIRRDNSDPGWTPITGNWEAASAMRIVCEGQGSSSVYAAATIGDLVLSLMQAWDAAAPMPDLQPVDPPAKKKRAPKHRDKRVHHR